MVAHATARHILREGVTMATSSIFHDIRITDPEEARRFLAACEASEQDQSWRRPDRPVTAVNTDRELMRRIVMMGLEAEGKALSNEGHS